MKIIMIMLGALLIVVDIITVGDVALLGGPWVAIGYGFAVLLVSLLCFRDAMRH